MTKNFESLLRPPRAITEFPFVAEFNWSEHGYGVWKFQCGVRWCEENLGYRGDRWCEENLGYRGDKWDRTIEYDNYRLLFANKTDFFWFRMNN